MPQLFRKRAANMSQTCDLFNTNERKTTKAVAERLSLWWRPNVAAAAAFVLALNKAPVLALNTAHDMPCVCTRCEQ